MTKNLKNAFKISIIIPAFNKVKYIRSTLQSIIDQKYPYLEVIIQDGGSTDGTVEVIKEFARKYPQKFFWISKKDKGQTDAINKGFKKASGDILTYINADDVYDKNALLEIGDYFLKNQDSLWVIGYGNIINSKGKIISKMVTKYKNFLININHYQILLILNYINQPSVFLSRSAYFKFGPFKGTNDYVTEYDLWLKIGKIQMPGIIKKNLSSFRLTLDNISSTRYNDLLSLDNKIASLYTNNQFILFFHRLHNLSRVGLISILKFYGKFLAW